MKTRPDCSGVIAAALFVGIVVVLVVAGVMA